MNAYFSNYLPQKYYPLWREYFPEAHITFTGLTGFGLDAKRRVEALDVDREIDVSAQRRIEALDVPYREGAYMPSLITLPDGGGYWLFGDGSRIMWGSGNTGTGGTVKRRIETLKVKRNG